MTAQDERTAAFKSATELLRECYIDYDMEELLSIADWIATGKCDMMIMFKQQAAENYGPRATRPRTIEGGTTMDAATWTRGDNNG